jgi:hypothetical protein
VASADLGLEATPTAIAIMTAVTKERGARPRSLLVIPQVGAFFVDIANAATIQAFIARLAAQVFRGSAGCRLRATRCRSVARGRSPRRPQAFGATGRPRNTRFPRAKKPLARDSLLWELRYSGRR